MKAILFSAPMARAILEGRKNTTRRLRNLKEQPQPYGNPEAPVPPGGRFLTWKGNIWQPFPPEGMPWAMLCKYAPWKPGELLWVREPWAQEASFGPDGRTAHRFYYQADGAERYVMGYGDGGKEITCPIAWQQSLFMPKAAARLFLRVRAVFFQRLKDITDAEAVYEGFTETKIKGCTGYYTPAESFGIYWDSLRKGRDLKRYGWEANPWVWVLKFQRAEKPEDWPDMTGGV